MVDREYIVDVLNKLRDPNMSLSILTSIIREYCLEKGKSEKDIDNFISALLHTNPVGDTCLLQCGLQALEYYKKKFNICELSLASQIILYY